MERFLNKVIDSKVDGTVESSRDPVLDHDKESIELRPLIHPYITEWSTLQTGTTLLFSDTQPHGVSLPKNYFDKETDNKKTDLSKRRSDTIYAFEVSIESPTPKYITKRSKTAEFCKFLDINAPTVKERFFNWLTPSGRRQYASNDPATKPTRASLPVDPALISNFDYCIPIGALQDIDVKGEGEAILDAQSATSILMNVFPGRNIREGMTKEDSLDCRRIDPVYGLEKFLNLRMTEKTLRKIILNRLIHLICNVMKSDLLKVPLDADNELWCIALSEEGGKDLAQKLGLSLLISNHAIVTTKAYCGVLPPECRPRMQYNRRLEDAAIRKGTINYLWERYNRLGEPVDIKEPKQLLQAELSIFTPLHRIQMLDLALADFLCLPHMTPIISGGHPFALHQPVLQERLRICSASFRYVWSSCVELDYIRDYFGDEIGIYYAFLTHYTKSLIWPVLMGITMAIVQMTLDPRLTFKGRTLAECRTIYAMSIALWVNVMEFRWRCQRQFLEAKWGIDDAQKLHRTYKQQNVMFKWDKWIVDDRLPTNFTKDYNKNKKKTRRRISRILSVIVISGVIVLTNPELHARFLARFGWLDNVTLWFQRNAILRMIDFDFESTITSLLILILHTTFKKFSRWIVKIENHKYHETYRRSLIKKFATFSLLDFASPFIYLAFLQRFFSQNSDDEIETEAKLLRLIAAQLRNLFLINMLSNIWELGAPFCERWLKEKFAHRLKNKGDVNHGEGRDPATVEFNLSPYGGQKGLTATMSDYSELADQLCLMASFSVCWAPISILSLLCNLVEIRVDLIKLVSLTRRPIPGAATSTEAWDLVFSGLAFSSIVLCNLLVAFLLAPDFSPVRRLGYVLLSTILCFSVKYLWLSSDKPPKDIVESTTRKQAILQTVLSHV